MANYYTVRTYWHSGAITDSDLPITAHTAVRVVQDVRAIADPTLVESIVLIPYEVPTYVPPTFSELDLGDDE